MFGQWCPGCTQARYDPFTGPQDKLRAGTRQRGTKINVSAYDVKWLWEGQVAPSNADISCITSYMYIAWHERCSRERGFIVTATFYGKTTPPPIFPVCRNSATLLKVGSDTEYYGVYRMLSACFLYFEEILKYVFAISILCVCICMCICVCISPLTAFECIHQSLWNLGSIS